MLSFHPLLGIGEVQPGDDLPRLLADAVAAAGLTPVRNDDVLVVTQKIVSKAEGRFVTLSGVMPGPQAQELATITGKDPRFVEQVLSESSAVVRIAPNVLITRHRSGHVMANSGIDRSNIGPGHEDDVLLLPENADLSAERLRAALARCWGQAPAVLISDSFGRPWRLGVTGVAIGAAGLPSLIDRRGAEDRDGRVLEVTEIALGDMIAAAAGLVIGEAAESVPAALVRGLGWGDAPERAASALVRPQAQDLFQ